MYKNCKITFHWLGHLEAIWHQEIDFVQLVINKVKKATSTEDIDGKVFSLFLITPRDRPKFF